MKISIRADEIHVGDRIDNLLVQVVEHGQAITVIHFGLSQVVTLRNTAEVLIERDVRNVTLEIEGKEN